MKSRHWFAVTLLIATSAPALAQPAQPTDDLAAFDRDVDALFTKGGLTAESAAAHAAQASPSVRRKVAEVDAAIATAEAAELTRVPQVGAKLAYNRLSPLDPITLGPGVSIPFLNNSYVAEATVVVPVSDYFLRYPRLIEAAHLAEDVAKVSRRSSEVSAGEDARLAFYEWVRSRLQVLISQRQLLQVQATLKQVRALAESQRLTKADLFRVESQEAEAERVVDQLGTIAQLREEQLRLLIGAGAEPLTIGEDIRTDVTLPPSAAKLDDAMLDARKQRLEFKILDIGIEAKEKQRAAEKSGRLPKLSAVGIADYANPNPRVFPQSDKFTLTWQLGLQLTWTLNDTLIERTTDRRLNAETNELRADRESLERGARIELLSAQQAVAIAQHALATSAKGLAAAQEGYRVRQALLAAERATAVELVDAETDLTRARIAALNARVDLRVAIAQLTHALGNDAR